MARAVEESADLVESLSWSQPALLPFSSAKPPFTCPSCNMSGVASWQLIRSVRLPALLIIRLGRTKTSNSKQLGVLKTIKRDMFGKKDMRLVLFPDRIFLPVKLPAASSSSPLSSTSSNSSRNDKKVTNDYRLKSIIMHSGSYSQRGHYTVHLSRHPSQPLDSSSDKERQLEGDVIKQEHVDRVWVTADDKKVYSTNLFHISKGNADDSCQQKDITQWFGSQQAYALVYELEKGPLKSHV